MLMRILFAMCTLSVHFAQSVDYVRYDNYTVIDYSSVVDQVVPTEADCLAVSNAGPFTNGVTYNDWLKLCRLLTADNNDILITLQLTVGWVTFVKDITTQTRMVYKVQADQSSIPQIYLAFNGTGGSYTSQYTAAVASLNTSQSCNCTYRNKFIDLWSANQVYYQFVKDGLVVAQTVFNAKESTKNSWFSKNNLLSISPYNLQNVRTQSYTSFAITHVPAGTYRRDFLLWTGIVTSCQDKYYMIATSRTPGCAYEYAPFPKLLYSATITDQIGATNGTLYADFMIVSVNVASRVVIVP